MSEQLLLVAERLKALRELTGMSEAEVAEKISIPVEDYISYESGQVDIPVSILYAMAHYFGIDLTELLTGEKAKLHMYSLVKNGKGIGVERGGDYHYKSLAYSYANRKIEPLLVYIDVEPEDKKMVPNFHEGHEFHYCLEGKYLMMIGSKEFVVEEGDSVYFDSNYPHAMKNICDKTVKLIVVVS